MTVSDYFINVADQLAVKYGGPTGGYIGYIPGIGVSSKNYNLPITDEGMHDTPKLVHVVKNTDSGFMIIYFGNVEIKLDWFMNAKDVGVAVVEIKYNDSRKSDGFATRNGIHPMLIGMYDDDTQNELPRSKTAGYRNRCSPTC